LGKQHILNAMKLLKFTLHFKISFFRWRDLFDWLRLRIIVKNIIILKIFVHRTRFTTKKS